MITEKAATKYITEGGIKCPKCGSGQIEGDSVDIDQHYITQEMWCNADGCASEWTAEYTLTGITERA